MSTPFEVNGLEYDLYNGTSATNSTYFTMCHKWHELTSDYSPFYIFVDFFICVAIYLVQSVVRGLFMLAAHFIGFNNDSQ